MGFVQCELCTYSSAFLFIYLTPRFLVGGKEAVRLPHDIIYLYVSQYEFSLDDQDWEFILISPILALLLLKKGQRRVTKAFPS